MSLAAVRTAAEVTCWFLDQHQWRLATQAAELAAGRPGLQLMCQADLPNHAIDLAVLPFSLRGEAELTRELLQGAWERLSLGGVTVTAVDNPNDRWLMAQLREYFPRIAAERHHDAIVYLARKDDEPRRIRDFRCQFAFRDSGRLLYAVSRPGVFAHRRVDPGARQLLKAAVVAPRMRVLDIGCGSGTVALGIASRDASIAVHAVDSNARAVECVLAGAALNGLRNISAELNSSGDYGAPGTFDLALANPPYYADFRIADSFLRAAHRSLRPGGQVLVVTKHPQWYHEHLSSTWRNVCIEPSKQYFVASAVRP